MKKLFAGIFLAMAAGASLTAQAALVIYNDRASFLAASSGFTTLDFEAQNPSGPTSSVAYASTLTIGSVTFTQAEYRLYVLGQSVFPTTSLTSNYLTENNFAPSGINATFANPVYGVGMDLGILYPWNQPNLSAIFNLSNGDTVTTIAPQLMFPAHSMSFFGFYSDTAFSSFNVSGTNQGITFDNFSFTSQAPQSPQSVPEPASFALLGLGLFALAANRSRRRNRRQINS
jgi:hypothetical protein